MNQSFYTAAVGASTQQAGINVHANNMANLQTTGFKSMRPHFTELLYQNMQVVDGEAPAEALKGSGSIVLQSDTRFEQGTLQPTNMPQDYAIDGRGFFAVQDVETGEVYYTRDGVFHIGSVQQGEEQVFYLLDIDGRYVLDQNGDPIQTTDGQAAHPVGVFDFANTDGMMHAGSNRFVPIAKNGPALAGEGQLRQGMLESSNADFSAEMAEVVQRQRMYSYVLKMVQTSDEIETTINGLRG